MENIQFSLDGFDDQAEKYEDDSLIEIISGEDDTTLEELERNYYNFLSMPKPLQVKSDTQSIELYGLNNTDHYNLLKAKLLQKETDDNDSLEYKGGEVIDIHEEEESIPRPSSISDEKISQALAWANDNMIAIVYPVKTLEELEILWNNFLSMSMDKRARSNSQCMDSFGINNEELYNYLKALLIPHEDKMEQPEDMVINPDNIDTSQPDTSIQQIEELFDNIISGNSIEESMNILNNMIPSYINKPILEDHEVRCSGNTLWSELPFFTPDEMINYGVFSGEANRFSSVPDNTTIGDRSVEEWFKDYYIRSKGITTTNENQSQWIYTLNKLYLNYDYIKEFGTIDQINSRKQSILELGWNPNIEFNSENRCKASKNTAKSIIESYDNFSLVNTSDVLQEYIISEDKKDSYKNPVSILLIRGNSLLAKTITKVTKSNFSHVAISLDNDLKKLYSFNHRDGFNGLSYESIDKYKKDEVKDITIFTFFIKPEQYRMLEKNIEYYILNKNKTKYSFMNLTAIPINISLDFDMKMVCSEFIDRILKFSNIDLTNKNNTLVTPNDIYKSIKDNKKVYLIYTGSLDQFNMKKAITKIRNLENNGEFLQEMNLYNQISVLEVKEFPVQFDNDGNLLIKKINKIDFNKEFSISHRLLMSYDKNNNIDGMKYELAKLQFLNNILENHIYYDKKDNKKQEYIKTRARILNDFNKYLNRVLKLDPVFIFGEYYESTPFSDAVIKIRSSTLKHGIQLIKTLF